jgi:hypothetical protein
MWAVEVLFAVLRQDERVTVDFARCAIADADEIDPRRPWPDRSLCAKALLRQRGNFQPSLAVPVSGFGQRALGPLDDDPSLLRSSGHLDEGGPVSYDLFFCRPVENH